MDIITERQLETAVEIAHSLFERGKVSGSTANISIRIGDFIYISGSGTSFGTLEKEQFYILDSAKYERLLCEQGVFEAEKVRPVDFYTLN